MVAMPHGSDRPQHLLGPYAALDHVFQVAVPDPDLADEIQRVLADLATDVDTGVCYQISRDGTGMRLAVDDEPVDAGPTPAHVLAMLLWDVNRRAVAAAPPSTLVLHAGAVVHHGIAIVLPAAMESGKTTLVTGLVRAACDYLSDELAAIPAGGTDVRAYPKAISLDPGSWPLFPELEPSPTEAAWSPTQWLVTAGRVRTGASGRRTAPLGMVVFPRHRSGAETRLERLPPVDALHRLATCAFEFHDRPDEILPRLAHLAERVPSWTITVGDGVEDAVSAILASVPTAGARGSGAVGPVGDG